jgi:biotin carboxyl carrier protein
VTFDVELAGRTRSVVVDPVPGRPGRYRVAIDGRPHVVDAARTDEFALSLLLGRSDNVAEGASAPSADARASVELGVTPGADPGDVLIAMGGRVVAATVNGRRRSRTADAGTHAHGEQAVVAPMPGRVVRVLVAAGDEVAARQGVVIVEAMKMENELRAPKAGRVKDVGVAPGTSVEAGRVLVVIE